MFATWKSKQITTKCAVIAEGKRIGKTEEAAKATAEVLLSPSKENPGNLSSKGHLYFKENLPRKTVDGKKEEQKYRLRWREQALERQVRGGGGGGSNVAAEKKVAEIKEMVTA